jgi:hypothetical protein
LNSKKFARSCQNLLDELAKKFLHDNHHSDEIKSENNNLQSPAQKSLLINPLSKSCIKPSISLDKVKKKDALIFLPQKSILLFEIFCMKWERFYLHCEEYDIIDTLYIYLKSYLPKEKYELIKVGSSRTGSLRNNPCLTDLVIKYNNDALQSDMLQQIFKVISEIEEIRESEFAIHIHQCDESIYGYNGQVSRG